MSSKLSALLLISLVVLTFSEPIWWQEDVDAAGSSSTTTDASSSTSETPCIDDPNTNCAQFMTLCDNQKYQPLLRQFCPVTCNFCPGATTAATTTAPKCTDNSSNCVNWVHNGFCTNSFYKCADRIKYCQKSCDLCNPSKCKDPKVVKTFMEFAEEHHFAL